MKVLLLSVVMLAALHGWRVHERLPPLWDTGDYSCPAGYA